MMARTTEYIMLNPPPPPLAEAFLLLHLKPWEVRSGGNSQETGGMPGSVRDDGWMFSPGGFVVCFTAYHKEGRDLRGTEDIHPSIHEPEGIVAGFGHHNGSMAAAKARGAKKTSGGVGCAPT